MRILDVHSMKLKEIFNENERPDYAILSHTWGDGEVSLQDLSTPAAKYMAGYSKIENCCKLAIQDGFEYVWIDTCCIDKTSSSELSEAINSTYQWYESATVCYVYLSDVKTGYDPSDPESRFYKSRWFRRGWTLQELLAPNTVIFYDCNWADIGTKSSLQDDISRITSILYEALSNVPMGEVSIAQRMSWAAKRETTRVEDIAYCLMGIFDVNMPTLYGEGRRAFIRLQHEIMKTSDDHSLFAWVSVIQPDKASPVRMLSHYPDSKAFLSDMLLQGKSDPESSLLAISPAQFGNSQDVRRREVATSNYPFSMTNHGLQIRLPLVPVQIENQKIFQAILNCEMLDGTGPLSIYLKQNVSGHYSRILTKLVCTANNVACISEPVELFVKATYPEELLTLSPIHDRRYTFHLVENPLVEHGYTLLECGPTRNWHWVSHTIFDLGIW